MNTWLPALAIGVPVFLAALGVLATLRANKRKESGDVDATPAEKLWDVMMKASESQQTQILQERAERIRLEERVQEISREVLNCEQRERRLLGVLAKAGIPIDGA